MIDFRDAQRRVIEACAPLERETIALPEAAGRVLADDIVAGEDLVPFARSAMDGFALRAAETSGNGVFPVRAAAYAQAAEPSQHVAGTATAIATGAPLPRGANAVVAVENVARENGSIRLSRALRCGEHVFPPGEDARRGERLVAAGTSLEPCHLGLLASAGCAELCVRRRPRVAVVCGGDELVPIDRIPSHGQIRNSNATTVRAFVERAGGTVASETTVPDDPEALMAALRRAFESADIVVTTGGASVGERDFMKPALRQFGAAFAFESVALRPARPAAFATLGTTRIIVLPGNPAAVFVALLEFVGPALAALQGAATLHPPKRRARLDGYLHAKPNRTYLPFVHVRWHDGYVATPLDNQCSALTRTAAEAHGLAVIEAGERDYIAGDEVDVHLYRTPAWDR